MGGTKLEKFLHKNQHAKRKLLNFENWTTLQKSEFLKLIISYVLPLFLVPKLSSVSQNEWKKHPYIFFLLLVKKNEFEWKKLEKN